MMEGNVLENHIFTNLDVPISKIETSIKRFARKRKEKKDRKRVLLQLTRGRKKPLQSKEEHGLSSVIEKSFQLKMIDRSHRANWYRVIHRKVSFGPNWPKCHPLTCDLGFFYFNIRINLWWRCIPTSSSGLCLHGTSGTGPNHACSRGRIIKILFSLKGFKASTWAPPKSSFSFQFFNIL